MAPRKVAVYMGGVRGPADDSEKIELSLQQRQVAILAAFALVLLGVVFALGVMVGRQLASAALAAPAQPPPGDLRALDAERPRPSPVAAPVPVADAKAAGDGAEDPDAPAAAAKPAAKIAPDRAQPAPAAAVAKPVVAAAKPAPAAEAAPPTPEELAREAADDAEVQEPPAPKPAAAAKPNPAPAVAKASEPAAEPTDAQPAHLGKFTVQFGATQDHKDALKIAARAKAQGVKAPYIVTAHLEGKGTWYRLRAGAFDDREAAAAYSKTVDAALKGVHSAVMSTAN